MHHFGIRLIVKNQDSRATVKGKSFRRVSHGARTRTAWPHITIAGGAIPLAPLSSDVRDDADVYADSPAAVRLAMMHNGYAPLPCNGKQPARKAWEKHTETNEAEILLWDQMYPFCGNTGFLTRTVPVLDVDISHKEACNALFERIKELLDGEGELLLRIGNSPKFAVPFQTDRPFKKLKESVTSPEGDEMKLEFLCDGQQCVAFGRHPDTDVDYRWWPDSPVADPTTVNRTDLPAIDESRARGLLNDLAEILVRDFGYTRKAAKPKSDPGTGASGNGQDDLVDNIVSGRELHDSIAQMAAKLIVSGMSAGAAVNQIRALMRQSAARAQRPVEWQSRYSDVPRAVSTAQEKFGRGKDGPQQGYGQSPGGEWRQNPDPGEDAEPALQVFNAGLDTEKPPPRGWLLANQFCRKFLSSAVAPGGTGKSAVRYAQLIALATGRPITGEYVFVRCRVLLLSLEDDVDEIRRRIEAVCLHHKINREELDGWLFYAAPKKMKLAELNGNTPQLGRLEAELRKTITANKIDLVMLDPFVKAHGLEENSNGAMDYVCDILAALAIEYDIAVDAPHHAKKGATTAGDADLGRGGSAIRDAARLVYTLTQMEGEEAQTLGVPPEMRREYIRLDSAKVNLIPGSTPVAWFRLVGVALGNGNETYPSGDNIQTVMPWRPDGMWKGIANTQINAILNEIEAGLPGGSRFSKSATAAEDKKAWQLVIKHCPDKNDIQGKAMIKAWLGTGLLYEDDYHDEAARKDRKGLFVNNSKRPGVVVSD